MTEYTPEQQAEHRTEWVAALRSGDYQQGQSALKTASGSFCCLGVACDLAAKQGVTEFRADPCGCGNAECNSGRGYTDDYGSVATGTLPNNVRHWLGLESAGGSLKESIEYSAPEADQPRKATDLITLNDEANWDFAKIADLIEAGGVQVQE